MVCLRNISVDTLHKGDTDDDDDDDNNNNNNNNNTCGIKQYTQTEKVQQIGLSVLWVAYATHSALRPVPTLPR
jgi:hypothetical protein